MCYKRIQWSQLLHGVGECCYKRRYSGRSCYRDWANIQCYKRVSGCSCYRDWANIVIKGYSGCSYYSALNNVLVKYYNYRGVI